MKRIITICAECKKELKKASNGAVEQTHASIVLHEEVMYSHGICHECSVKLYGAEITTKIYGKNTISRL